MEDESGVRRERPHESGCRVVGRHEVDGPSDGAGRAGGRLADGGDADPGREARQAFREHPHGGRAAHHEPVVARSLGACAVEVRRLTACGSSRFHDVGIRRLEVPEFRNRRGAAGAGSRSGPLRSRGGAAGREPGDHPVEGTGVERRRVGDERDDARVEPARRSCRGDPFTP